MSDTKKSSLPPFLGLAGWLRAMARHPDIVEVNGGPEDLRKWADEVDRASRTPEPVGVPAGYALVPIEPTEAMGRAYLDAARLHAADGAENTMRFSWGGYRAMLATPPAGAEQQGQPPSATQVDTAPMYKALQHARDALCCVRSGAAFKALELIDGVLHAKPEQPPSGHVALPLADGSASEWRPIESAPKDGSTILLGSMEDGEITHTAEMQWSHIQQNALCPGLVGMWVCPGGNFTWSPVPAEYGPTHWKPVAPSGRSIDGPSYRAQPDKTNPAPLPIPLQGADEELMRQALEALTDVIGLNPPRAVDLKCSRARQALDARLQPKGKDGQG